jgi:hypothetical protein
MENRAGWPCRMRKERNTYRIFTGKPKGNSPYGRRRRRWEDDLRMYLQGTGYVLWIALDWLRRALCGVICALLKGVNKILPSFPVQYGQN